MREIVTEIISFFSKRYAQVQVDKKRIRQEIRVQKKLITDEDRLNAENAVFQQIESFDCFKNADVILIYWAIKDELPTQATIQRWCDSKTILLPAIEGEKLLLKRYFKDGKMIQKTLGIMEPDLNEIYTGKVDLVIVPGVAFDRAKNRLGRGRGYYDRFFKKMKPTKIGVGFDFQLLSSVPAAKHDIAMDIIVTPSETIK